MSCCRWRYGLHQWKSNCLICSTGDEQLSASSRLWNDMPTRFTGRLPSDQVPPEAAEWPPEEGEDFLFLRPQQKLL